MEFNGLTSASHMSLPEAGYGSEEGQLGSEISGAVSGVTTPGASRLQASQLQERSATMQPLHSINSLLAWYNLAESTQSVHNHQGIVVVMTLGSVNEVHIQQCIDHVWQWQHTK